MQQRNSLAPSLATTLSDQVSTSASYSVSMRTSSLRVSTADSGVQETLVKAFADVFELNFYKSLSELNHALPHVKPASGVILIDLDSEENPGKILDLPKENNRLPLILLASEINLDACREHFHAGVEDILLKPLNLSELIVKTERAIGCVRKTVRNYLELLSVLEAELTITELRILSHFFEQPSRTANRKSLTEHIWSRERVHPKALDVHLFNLRSKISKAQMRIDYDPLLKGWKLKTQDA